MGVTLSDRQIVDFDACVHRELLTYVKYPASKLAGRCFAYPQFLISDDGELSLLADSAFPDVGCLPMVMAETDADDMMRRYGDVVVMVVNDDSLQLNRNYPETEPSRFNGIINPLFPKGKSAIEFMPLSRHQLSASLMQVLEVQETVDFSSPVTAPVHLYPEGARPRTNLALVAQSVRGGRRLFGPFECTCAGDEVSLRPSGSFGMCIAGIEDEAFTVLIDLANEDGLAAAQFVDAGEFAAAFAATEERYDWITDAELLDALGRVSRTGDDALSKAQMRTLKGKIATCSFENAKIDLTPERRQRMAALLGVYGEWKSLSDTLKAEALEGADPEQLAGYVLSNEHFQGFYDKVIENDQVRDQVERDREHYRLQVEQASREAAEACERRDAIRDELATFEERLEAKKRELACEIEAQTHEARQEREALTGQIAQLHAQKETLEEERAVVEGQIRDLVASLSDEVALSNKILESGMVGRIVASLNASDVNDPANATASVSMDAPAVLLRPDESGLSASNVLDILQSLLCDVAGRDLSRNEVANLMICLTQGYILTFAGLPGTGKTSLATLLAGALGLTNDANRRFAEVSVERGWTSYKDFIGYYNPLTKTMEKSNATAFDAFAQLDAETRRGIGPDATAPYLFLLDEANLSSIEHYWSPFLRACDAPAGSTLDLSLGGDCLLKVPDYVRFVATVNFDHTTEELSARFLDRSWIITLDPEDLDIEGEALMGSTPDFSDLPAFSYAKLREVFGVKRGANMSVALRSKLREVIDICARHHYPVSPRSQKMVWNYVCAADGLMQQSTAQSSFAPVDFAVTQKILPLFSGTEERLEGLLDELSAVVGLPIMKARVDHMREVGNECGYYQYFA